ncbi:hydroxyacid dehydrogenase [Alkalihalophilus lindianensis]|uniref:Hydroxyacid dehydrogenase n=1 Tax=Alkalihalophilus lindianensis TaxID=1630542 RepID=A0ABU3X4R4_9BACI|nr:hydroxyacid dehydrogenase [Alkalihalophilus lindianensis]MDV2682883.1 hydroxyacid dehydrogenase [Alkalihalophilus lindianensis]
MSYKVVIAKGVSEVGKAYLLERNYTVIADATPERIRDEIKTCDAILARTEVYTPEMLEEANHLKVIAKNGVGYDNFPLEKATERGIYITNAPHSNAVSVAEHTLSLMMALAKNLLISHSNLQIGNFDVRNQIVNCELEGKVLGIIGYGRIGSILANKASNALNMNVICYDPYVNPKAVIPEVKVINQLERVLSRSDFISLHLPLTNETKGLISGRELSVMKKTSFLLNAGRGGLVNEADLFFALKEKIIAGAAIDVFEEEPPAPDHPLLSLDNILVTPHSAALTVEAKDRMALHAAIGIDEVLSGRQPSWPVNQPDLS